MSAGSSDESNTDAAAPLRGIDIERTEFAVIGHVRVARGRSGGESVDVSILFRDDGSWLLRIPRGEVIVRGAVFGAELVEVFFGKECAVRGLP